ncbi:hypothetical protein ID0462_14310 [Helicobacter pylori]
MSRGKHKAYLSFGYDLKNIQQLSLNCKVQQIKIKKKKKKKNHKKKKKKKLEQNHDWQENIVVGGT